MLKFLPMVVRNAARNRARTAITVGVVLLGTTLLFAFLSVGASIDGTVERTSSTGHVVVQEEFRR